jgi:hypothetical protein
MNTSLLNVNFGQWDEEDKDTEWVTITPGIMFFYSREEICLLLNVFVYRKFR